MDWRLLRDCLKVYWRNSWGATVVDAWNGLKAGRGFRCRWLIVRRPQEKVDSCLKQMTVSYCECFWGTQNPTSSGPDYQNGRSRTKPDVARRWILAPIAFVPVMRIENCDGIARRDWKRVSFPETALVGIQGFTKHNKNMPICRII